MDIFIEKLENKVQTGEFKYEDFEKSLSDIKDCKKRFQDLLEYAIKTKNDDKKFENLYRRTVKKNISELIDILRNKGYGLKNNNNLKESFENMSYRLLEQTRNGKRDEVYYGILRIFIANNKEFPKELIEAFKPIYSEEMFKVFIFSFLSGIIGKEQQY